MLQPDTESEVSVDQLREDVVQAQTRRDQKKEKNWNVTLTSLPTSAPSSSSASRQTSLSVVEHVLSTNLIDRASLVFVGTPEMELKLDFLNRVRMNSIEDRQIFCPVPYVSFHPKVVRWINRTVKKPVGSSGHFDPANRKHVAFYASDFWKAKEKISLFDSFGLEEDSVCSLFRSVT